MDILDRKIQQLGQEADALVQRKIALENEIHQVEIRLTQIVGAITEIKNIKQEHADEESKDDSEISQDS